MSRKNNLPKFQNITNGDMSQTSITSSVTNIQHLDNIAIQINWSGTSPVGVVTVQVSVDYAQDPNGQVQNSGNWVNVNLPQAATISANSGSIFIDLNQLASPWIRVVYTKTSGIGTLQGFISAKMI